MNDKAEKHIEELVDKMMKETNLESPSKNFNANLMAHIEAASTSEITTYRPLISKYFFIGAIVFIIIISGFVISMGTTKTEGWLSIINFETLFNNNSLAETLNSVKISKTVVYSIVFFGLMLFIQIPLLKNYFDKRLKL